MARGFWTRGRGTSRRYVARLDPLERATIAGLMTQVRDLLEPPAPSADGGDDFESIVSRLGLPASGLGLAGGPDAGVGQGGQIAEQEAVPTPGVSLHYLVSRDPAMDRLLPMANRDDEQAAAEFRRLTENGLRRRKADGLERAIQVLAEGGSTLELDGDSAQALLVALTDVRLVLGDRLGLRTDEDAEKLHVQGGDEDGPRAYAIAVYDFLSWLQQTLAEALLSGGPR